MDWSALSVLTVIVLAGLGYLARQLDGVRDETRGGMGQLRGEMSQLRDEVRGDIGVLRDDVRSLTDAYVRHLEHHAAR